MTDATKQVEDLKTQAEADMKPLLEEITAKQSALQEELRAVGRKYLTQAADEIFAQFPQVESFGWAQYTPYFNDGDECVFSVYTDREMISINGKDYYEEDEEREEEEPEKEDENGKFYYYYYGEGHRAWISKRTRGTFRPGWFKSYYTGENFIVPVDESEVPWREVAAQKIAAVLETLVSSNSGFFKDLFGDHVRVTITKDGYETEEYEHD